MMLVKNTAQKRFAARLGAILHPDGNVHSCLYMNLKHSLVTSTLIWQNLGALAKSE